MPAASQFQPVDGLDLCGDDCQMVRRRDAGVCSFCSAGAVDEVAWRVG